MSRGAGLPILDEEESLLVRAKSTVLNTFSNKQIDFLKQRLQAVKKYKTDIIITALFFHIGLDLSYFTPDKQHSTKRLRDKVTEALDQVNNNMDSSINMNQAGSNDSETQKMLLKIRLAEIQNQTAEAEARKAEAEAKKAEADTSKAYAATARARAAEARQAALETAAESARAAINISRDNAITCSNLTRMLNRQNDNNNSMLRENNLFCSPAAIKYQPRRLSRTENESIDLMPRGDSVSNEEDRLRPLAEVVIPQNFDRESNPEGSNRPTRSSPRNSPSFARGGVSSEEFASAFGVNPGGNNENVAVAIPGGNNENVAVANRGGNGNVAVANRGGNENVPVANRGGNGNVAIANRGGNENVAVNNEEEIIDQGLGMPLFANSGSTRNTRSMKRRRIMRGG